MAELIGDKIIGWKIGSAVRAIQIAEGHDGPIPGRMFASRLYPSPAVLPASDFKRSKVECELAFRAIRDFSAAGGPYCAAAIDEGLVFLPAIEIAASRYDLGAGARPRHTFDEIADNGNGAGFVAGTEVEDWRRIDFGSIVVDAGYESGPHASVHGPGNRRDPFEVAVEMINDIVTRGHEIAEGQYLTTGSLTLPQELLQGRRFHASFGKYGVVECTLS
jgi:2-keto-4-pentenoate hydratase